MNGKTINIVKVRDPVNNRVIATIKNPQVKIEPFRDPEKNKIDLHQAIVDGVSNPLISSEPNMKYKDRFKGWQEILQLLGEKQMQ